MAATTEQPSGERLVRIADEQHRKRSRKCRGESKVGPEGKTRGMGSETQDAAPWEPWMAWESRQEFEDRMNQDKPALETVSGPGKDGRTMLNVSLDFKTMSKLEALRQAMGFKTTFEQVISKLADPEKTEADERALRALKSMGAEPARTVLFGERLEAYGREALLYAAAFFADKYQRSIEPPPIRRTF